MKRAFLGFFLCAGLFLSACENQNSKETQLDNSLWSLEKEIMENSSSVEVQKFNEAIEVAQVNKQAWAFSPAAIALKIAGQQMISNALNMAVESTSSGEVVTEVKAIIEKKDILDDSLHSQYLLIRLKLYGSIWKIETVQEAFMCRRGSSKGSIQAKKCL